MALRTHLNPLAALDDRALLGRFMEQCDQESFEQVVKRHGRLVAGVCRRLVRDAHLAEDAYQAVFLVLARNPGGAVAAASVGGWLFGVARRVGLAARRHERRRARRDATATSPTDCGEPPPASDLNDLLRALDEELAAIPDEPRAALVACFLEERTQDQAARELGWSLSTLRRRLERGKELLRARLARRGVALGAGLLTAGLAAPAGAAVPPLGPSPSAAALANEVLKRGLGLKLAGLVAVVVLAVGGLACGFPDAPKPSPVPPTVAEPAPQPRPVAAAWVTVTGRVTFPANRAAPAPEPVPIGAAKDAEAFRPFLPLRFEHTLVDPDTRGLANAVVWLRPDSDDPKAAVPPERVRPTLRSPASVEHPVQAVGGQFRPRVLAVRAGDTVAFDNRLGVNTNVKYDTPAHPTRDFNVLLPPGAVYASKPVPAERGPDVFESNVHHWMRGYVRAFEHPYFAVTATNGRFELRDVPPGRWRLVVWHESAGYLGGATGRLGAAIDVPAARAAHELTAIPFASNRWPTP